MFELEPIDFPVKNAFLQNQILIIYIQLIFLCKLLFKSVQKHLIIYIQLIFLCKLLFKSVQKHRYVYIKSEFMMRVNLIAKRFYLFLYFIILRSLLLSPLQLDLHFLYFK